MTNSMKLRYILTLAVLISSVAQGHEFWIQPASMRFTPGELLTIRLMHGERFQGEPVPVNTTQVKRFELIYSSEELEQVRSLNLSETSFIRPRRTGIVVYESNHYTNTLDADHFEAYLNEEQLYHIIDERDQRHETHLPGREIYSRCAKSIILSADTSSLTVDADMVVGLPLEIIIDQIKDSNSTDESNALSVSARILFRGEPIQRVRAVAVNADDPSTLIELETDESGRIEFQTSTLSHWMITALYMERIKTEEADWESFWSSTTFQLE